MLNVGFVCVGNIHPMPNLYCAIFCVASSVFLFPITSTESSVVSLVMPTTAVKSNISSLIIVLIELASPCPLFQVTVHVIYHGA
ncbi:hypothetical protein EDD16DRAFT_1624866 [Pisolithus croceorrhizus]|nr:hypothetical protein EDD16DRAFT_1624866 [Pisolithus croceorrhizus]